MAVERFFFSADPTAKNSQELHFRFINYFIPSSLLRSLLPTHFLIAFYAHEKSLHIAVRR